MPLLRFIVARAVAIMLAGVLLGIVFQPLATLVRPALVWLLILSLTMVIMRTDLRTLGGVLRRPLPSILQVVWLLLVSPTVMYAILYALPVPENIRGPLVVFAATPPIVSMPAFALLFGLDASFVLIGVSATALLSPFTLPPIASLVMGDQMAISAAQLALRLGLLIGCPYVLGSVLRRALGAERIAGWKIQFDATFVVTATLIGIAVVDGIVTLTLADPLAMAIITAAVVSVTFMLFVVATLLFLPAGKAMALGAGLNSGPRNISIVLAVFGAGASPELVMVVAAAQIPIFFFPIFQRPLIRRVMHDPVATM